MLFKRSKAAKAVDREWHEMRRKARENTLSLAEWSPEEISKYDLETARITGRENKRTYTVDRPIDTPGTVENGTDLRTLDSR